MHLDETFEVMNCDVIGLIEHKSARGHACVMVIVDWCCWWIETLTAKAACDALLEVFACTGIPRVLVCDKAAKFTTVLSTGFRGRSGCAPRFLTPYHPEGYAIVKRQNATNKNMLHHVICADPCNNDKELPILLWAIWNVPNNNNNNNKHFFKFTSC